MLGFRIKVGPGSPRSTSSLSAVGSPRPIGTPKAMDVGEIDTRAPFQSVKAAVSLFGEVGASPKAKTPLLRKSKTVEERVLEKETHLHLVLKELNKFKEHLKNVETIKVQALGELEKAKRTMHELTSMLEYVCESKQEAVEATEFAKNRVKQLEEEKSGKMELNGVWKQDVHNEREQYKASTHQLNSAKQELTNLRQDFDATLEAKFIAFQEAADAQNASKVSSERLSELSKEVVTMHEALAQLKLTSLRGQEEQEKLMAEKVVFLQSHRATKEQVDNKIKFLKGEADLEIAGNLEDMLEEATEAITVLQQQLRNVCNSDSDALNTSTWELDDAKKAMHEALEERGSFRSLVDSLKLELDHVRRETAELNEKESKAESSAESLQVELEKCKVELEMAFAGLTDLGDAPDNIHLKLQELSSEVKNGRRDVGDMKRNAEALKQEAETYRIEAKDVEEKLQIALKEAEQAKAEAVLANSRIHNSSARSDAANSESTGKFKLSTEEFQSLSKKAKEFNNATDIKVANYMAHVEEINANEKAALKNLEASMREIEDIKVATEDAFKKAEMSEAAKQAVEGELRKWRQKEEKKVVGEASDVQEDTKL